MSEPDEKPFNSDDDRFFLTDDEYDGDPFEDTDDEEEKKIEPEPAPKTNKKRTAKESGSDTEPETIKLFSIFDAEAVLIPIA